MLIRIVELSSYIMTKKSFQDSVDWDDIMFDNHPDENGNAAEWDNFNVATNFASDTAKSGIKPQSTTTEKKKEPRKSSKKSSTSRSTDRCPDSPTEEDDKSCAVRKPSSTKNKNPKRERARGNPVQRHDGDSDSDDDDLDDKNRTASTNSKRTSQLSNKDSNRHRSRSPSVSRRQIHRCPSVSRRKERQSVPIDEKEEKKQSVSSKIKREKRSGDDDASVRNKDNESARESRKNSEDASVKRATKDDATAKKDDQKKLKEKKEKNREVDENDNQTLSQSSHRRAVSVRKSRSIDDKLDNQSVDTRDSSRLRRRSGQLNVEQLSQSRQRAVQRVEARNSWRESQRKSGTCSDADDDRTIDDSRRASLLDQSRRGPIRSIRHDDDDDDDDDFSVLSGVSSSFTVNDTIDAPFIAKNIKNTAPGSGHGGGYLPNSLNHTNTNDSGTFQKKERRPSAFGSGYERAQALNQLKSTLDHNDDSDGESCSSYMLPTSLARSAGAQFEIDRSGRGGASTRRPSLSTALVIPCVNGVDDSDNEDDLYSKSMDRRGSLSSKELDQSSKAERRGSLSTRNVDDDKKGYDSTVEDMLKSRRLRGARGDAAKKKEETKKVKKTRGLSISMLTNLVHSGSKTTPEPPATGSSAHRRASTTM